MKIKNYIIRIKFEYRDGWIGYFFDNKHIERWDLYICIIPYFPIKITSRVKK